MGKVDDVHGAYFRTCCKKSVAELLVGATLAFHGRLGRELTTEDGYPAAELCARNVLAQINRFVGFERILGLNRIEAGPSPNDAPQVGDGMRSHPTGHGMVWLCVAHLLLPRRSRLSCFLLFPPVTTEPSARSQRLNHNRAWDEAGFLAGRSCAVEMRGCPSSKCSFVEQLRRYF